MEYFEPHWYAAYTCANHEKRIARQLQERDIEYFLPLYETVHRWKDRHMRLQLPLFPSYVFVRLPLCDRLRVLQVPSVVRFVGFGDLPTVLPEVEIESLRKGLRAGLGAQPHPYLTTGRRVRIKSGSLAGMEGIFLRRKGSFRVVLSIELIMRSIALEVDISDVVPLSTLKVTHRA
jgi:transcription termination/antitermination protein NusG